ncbi:MAG: tol-pal system protein YbgF [Pseudomonadota bacterium]|jgi:TolA-binding protein
MTRNLRNSRVGFWLYTGIALALSACASAPKHQPEELVQELRDQVSGLTARLEGMELRVTTLQEELRASKTALETVSRQTKEKPASTDVLPPVTASIGKEVEPTQAPSDPQAHFASDSATVAYRNAMVLFDSKKYPESMLAFTAFLDQYADHPWAGSAQFYIGQSYFFQKEYRLALQEYQRVITSYDRSPHVADALKQMAICEDELKMQGAAAQHRQLLSSLFPSSPAAAADRARLQSTPSTPSTPEPTEAKASTAEDLTAEEKSSP